MPAGWVLWLLQGCVTSWIGPLSNTGSCFYIVLVVWLQQSWALTSFQNNQPKESRSLKRKYLLLLSAEFLIIGWLYIMDFIPREDLLNNMVLFSNIFLSNKCNSMGKKHFHFIYNNSYLQDDHIVNVLHPFFKSGKMGWNSFSRSIFWFVCKFILYHLESMKVSKKATS